MNDLERTFRDGLRQAVADRPGEIRVDVDEVIARASSPDFDTETGWAPPRWLAAAAAVLVVAGLGVTMAVFRPSAGIPAVPAAPSATASSSTQLGTSSAAVEPSRTLSPDGAVHVRLYNDTSVTLHDVTVTCPNGVAIREATMAPGSYSEFMSLEVAYRIASLEAKVDGRTYRLQPTDYVGEEPLKPGSYTYSIRLTEGVMFLEFGY